MILTGKFRLTASILLVFAWQLNHLQAQESVKKLITASFSQVTLGTSAFYSPAMTTYLKRDELLGSQYKTTSHCYHAGTEMSVCINRFTIGCGGMVLTPFRGSSLKGDTRLSMSGAFCRAGYRLKTHSSSFKHMYAGFGIMRSNLAINNRDSSDLRLSSEYALKTGHKELLWCDYLTYDIGFALKSAVMPSAINDRAYNSGLILGLELGCMLLQPVNSWRTETYISHTMPAGRFNMLPYIKLTVGPGGYSR